MWLTGNGGVDIMFILIFNHRFMSDVNIYHLTIAITIPSDGSQQCDLSGLDFPDREQPTEGEQINIPQGMPTLYSLANGGIGLRYPAFVFGAIHQQLAQFWCDTGSVSLTFETEKGKVTVF